MPFLHPKKEREPLWKEWDSKANKKGVLNPVHCVNGNQYIGSWLDNKRHGKGTYKWKETNKVYDGDWKKGKRSGFGTLTHSDGKGGFTKEYSGGWKNDLRHGYGTEFYSDDKFYEGEWYAGKRSGWGRMYYEDGTIYEGEWYDDKRSGQGMLRLTNENRYEGSWKDDKKNGVGKFYYLDTGQVFEGVWKDDVPKCGVMKDFGRENAPEPTQYPIPEIKLADPEAVIADSEDQFLQDPE
ncbi:MORN repeat-containing protein 3-like isoform X2 [Biomphalaria glabrata]|uniref:MORN repeat-containing protein 3 n=1 Tax=Biomphalaria glabrata TaxID=6526 RepID=A0A9W3AHM6_BIOGL|nr:MORN repeat-containing protein 3-like isoform X2 [Biomphalaria glabrata]